MVENQRNLFHFPYLHNTIFQPSQIKLVFESHVIIKNPVQRTAWANGRTQSSTRVQSFNFWCSESKIIWIRIEKWNILWNHSFHYPIKKELKTRFWFSRNKVECVFTIAISSAWGSIETTAGRHHRSSPSILQLEIKTDPDYFFWIILFLIGAFIGFYFTRMAKIIDNYISIQFRIAFRLYLFISWFIINDFRCFWAIICFQTSTSQLSKERLISP